MPHLQASDGCSIHYRYDGEEGRPVVMLSNSLGSTLEMWEPQMPALTGRYRVLRYDNRGHGLSDVPPGPYTLERIARDARELIAHQGVAPVLWCGLSLGGMVGMWLAANAPGAIKRAVLANTSAMIGQPEVWRERIAAVEQGGTAAIASGVLQRWLTAGYIEQNPAVAEKTRGMIASTPSRGYAASAAAVRDMDLRDSLSRIGAPVLVIAGCADVSTPPAMAEEIIGGIAGARGAFLEAAHLSNIEQADEFNRLMLKFFEAA
jgi:3-oxoadipate enol-lactonase